jgi:glycerophosphoryl diester phosphodiesterase
MDRWADAGRCAKHRKPSENTVDSVRQAYGLGARVVEVDVQLTRDGRLAVFHDDFLSDSTCLHSLTLDQLQQRLPYVPELRQAINVAREFSNRAGDDLGGILIVELKPFRRTVIQQTNSSRQWRRQPCLRCAMRR